jgi:hypothetical protein
VWVERNTHYKQAGYCFRTRRALQYSEMPAAGVGLPTLSSRADIVI